MTTRSTVNCRGRTYTGKTRSRMGCDGAVPFSGPANKSEPSRFLGRSGYADAGGATLYKMHFATNETYKDVTVTPLSDDFSAGMRGMAMVLAARPASAPASAPYRKPTSNPATAPSSAPATTKSAQTDGRWELLAAKLPRTFADMDKMVANGHPFQDAGDEAHRAMNSFVTANNLPFTIPAVSHPDLYSVENAAVAGVPANVQTFAFQVVVLVWAVHDPNNEISVTITETQNETDEHGNVNHVKVGAVEPQIKGHTWWEAPLRPEASFGGFDKVLVYVDCPAARDQRAFGNTQAWRRSNEVWQKVELLDKNGNSLNCSHGFHATVGFDAGGKAISNVESWK